jgi:hypothetical protein
MWSYVHRIQIWISELALSCLSILLIVILLFLGLKPELLQSLSIPLFILIFSLCLLEAFTAMFFSQHGHLATILNQISHFDEGTPYKTVMINNSHISVSNDHNIRSLGPCPLYSYEICLVNSENDHKVMIFMRLLNKNATALEEQFFDKLRKAVSRRTIAEYSNCKYGRVVNFEKTIKYVSI